MFLICLPAPVLILTEGFSNSFSMLLDALFYMKVHLWCMAAVLLCVWKPVSSASSDMEALGVP